MDSRVLVQDTYYREIDTVYCVMLLEEDDIVQYVRNKDHKYFNNKQLIRFLTIEIKTSQFCKPFRNREEAEQKLDMTLEWFMTHVNGNK